MYLSQKEAAEIISSAAQSAALSPLRNDLKTLLTGICVDYLQAHTWQSQRLAESWHNSVLHLLIDPIGHAAFWQERAALAKAGKEFNRPRLVRPLWALPFSPIW